MPASDVCNSIEERGATCLTLSCNLCPDATASCRSSSCFLPLSSGVRSRSRNSTLKHTPIRRLLSLKSPRSQQASPQRNMSVFTLFQLKWGWRQRPGSTTSILLMGFHSCGINYSVDHHLHHNRHRSAYCSKNVSLPNNVAPQIQASSLVGEIYRYQVTGQKHFGITNLRTVQDWILQRRFLTVPELCK